MFKRFLSAAVFIFISAASSAQSVISEVLQQQLEQNEAGKTIRVYAWLSSRADIAGLQQQFRNEATALSDRAPLVISSLKEAAGSQQEIVSFITSWNVSHSQEAILVKRYYICNMLVIEAGSEFISALANQPGVEFLEWGYRYNVKYIPPTERNLSASRSVGGHEPGLETIHAPFMWNLGYTGLGRKLYTVDTGVWTDHPAITRQWRGNYLPQAWCWKGFDLVDPGDKPDAHGTHVTGNIVGLDPATADTIGIAFNASYMATDPIVENPADVNPIEVNLTAFEFALNPDGDANTTDDIPDVINNSWGVDNYVEALCTASFIADLFNALDAAGIAVEFSAGNNGPGASTIGLPAFITLDSLTIFTVGAVDAHSAALPIADFSSRGPILCDVQESWKIKPEVTAPGVNIRSSVQHDLYAEYSGTSMAGPHVSGSVLLLKEAFPYLPGRELLNALYQTTTDLGVPGEDNTFGRGIINLEAAYNFLALTHTPVGPNVSEYDLALDGIIISPINCPGPVSGRLIIRNAGSVATGAGFITLKMDGVDQGQVTWSTILEPGERDTIDLPVVTTTAGRHELYAILVPSGNFIERELLNNSRTVRFHSFEQVNLPFTDGFENHDFTDPRWFLVNPDNNRTWDTTHTAGLENSYFSARMNFLTYSNRPAKDDIYSPVVTVPTGTDSFMLRFDVSYNFRNPTLTDTFEISVSADCGETWTEIYQKGGELLSTIDTNWNSFRPYAASHWRTEYVDLTAFSDPGKLMFRFRTINDGGAALYLDNIGIYSGQDPTTIISLFPEWNLYPNPASGFVNFTVASVLPTTAYYLMDAQGRILLNGKIPAGNNQGQLDVSGITAGMYFIVMENELGRGVKKLMVH